MSINQALLPEYDQEMAGTRKYLANYPSGKNDWKPHDKSMSLVQLASHIAELPSWVTATLTMDSLDLAPKDGEPYKTEILTSRDELLKSFDAKVAAGRTALEAATDEQFGQPWSLLMGGEAIFTMPRLAVIRTMVMNHIIHHRGQLGVYYRLQGVLLPALYGPSADDQSF